MPRCTRAAFIRTGATLAGGAAVWGSFPAPSSAAELLGLLQATEADLAVINARVDTVDPALPRAQALAVKDGRFIAVGSTADIKNLITARTRVIDAAGMTVTPGFIDAHCHPSGVNELYGVDLDLRSVRAVQDALRKKAASTRPGFWVSGFKFDDTKLADGPLHRRHLDEAVPDHPVEVNHRGGHTSWYNSKAFELAGITAATPDPQGGRFFRDAGGLNGRVAELARGVFRGVGQRERFTPEQQRERARKGMAHMSRLLSAAGLTSVHDAGAGRERMQAYEDARADGQLRHRAYAMIRDSGLLAEYKKKGIKTGFGDEWIRVGGVKYAADGSASERTMRMSTPYVGTSDYGILTMSQPQIDAAVEDDHRHGFQVGIHANGDVTIDMVLKAYARVLEQWPDPNRRHRIEHCSLVNPDLLARIRQLGVVPTPFWTYIHYHGEKWKEYGDDKMRWMFAHRSFLDAGIVVAGASDYTPGPFEPLMAIQSMVTRKDIEGRVWGPNQRVSVDEALRIGTINGAHASSEEKIKGSIAVGKLADFVVLERDPHEVDPDAIKAIKVVRTVAGGKTVHPVDERS
jgi:hypothetical protein